MPTKAKKTRNSTKNIVDTTATKTWKSVNKIIVGIIIQISERLAVIFGYTIQQKGVQLVKHIFMEALKTKWKEENILRNNCSMNV